MSYDYMVRSRKAWCQGRIEEKHLTRLPAFIVVHPPVINLELEREGEE
jgi:hypothetical protein